MTLFKDYLREKAKFYSPPTGGAQTSATDVCTADVERLPGMWRPRGGRKDQDMVDNLYGLVDRYLANRELPEPQSTWDKRFEPEVDDNHSLLSWSTNNLETHAMGMVKFGAINALVKVMSSLGAPIQVLDQSIPPEYSSGQESSSKVNYVLKGEQRGTVLIEVKAPHFLDLISHIFDRNSFRISMQQGEPIEGRIINKICLYMATHRAYWLALTSHHKWVFFRFHAELDEPYVSYSSVIPQENDTRPFRALLGMMIAEAFGVQGNFQVNKSGKIEPIKEEKRPKDEPPRDHDKQDKSRTFKGRGESSRQDHPVLRSQTQAHTETSHTLQVGKNGTYTAWGEVWKQGSPEFRSQKVTKTKGSPIMLMSWSRRVADHDHWFSFDTAFGTDWCLSLSESSGPVMLRWLRIIGEGIAGTVYEAKIDVDGRGEDLNSRSLALKVVEKRDGAECLIKSLYKELEMHRIISQAVEEGRIKDGIVPHCYGLYESKEMVVLVMEHGGEALNEDTWARLTYGDKIEIFKMLLSLHDIGISHADIDTRNILRSADGSFKIIDFSLSALHECEGIRDVSWFVENSDDIGLDDGCNELNCYWRRYMRHYPANGGILIDGR